MISKLKKKDFSLIKGLLEDYYSVNGRKHYNNVNLLFQSFESAVLTDEISIYYSHRENNFVSGIAVSQIERKQFSIGSIGFLYIHSSFNEKINQERKLIIENELIEQTINKLKQECDYISVKNIKLSERGMKSLLTLGLIKYSRTNMKISKDKILSLKSEDLPPNYEIIHFEENFLDETANLLVDSNKGHIDSKIFPDFSNIEASKEMINNFINNKSGKFKKECSNLIKFENKIIGYCFISVFDGKIGFILDVGIAHNHRRKGLAKCLIIYSMNNLIKLDEKIELFELAVTLENKSASNLYEKLGFDYSNYFDVFIWNKNLNNKNS